MSLQYTPGQLRGAVNIAPETYRHWKKALAPLRRDKGHSPSFSVGDLVATAVVRTLVVELSVRVGALSAIADPLFSLCNGAPWPTLERGKLLLGLPNAEVSFCPELADVHQIDPMIVVPLRPLIAHLRDQLVADGGAADQPLLKFPPTPLSLPGETQLSRRQP